MRKKWGDSDGAVAPWCDVALFFFRGGGKKIRQATAEKIAAGKIAAEKFRRAEGHRILVRTSDEIAVIWGPLLSFPSAGRP